MYSNADFNVNYVHELYLNKWRAAICTDMDNDQVIDLTAFLIEYSEASSSSKCALCITANAPICHLGQFTWTHLIECIELTLELEDCDLQNFPISNHTYGAYSDLNSWKCIKNSEFNNILLNGRSPATGSVR